MEHHLNAYITIIPPVCSSHQVVQAKLAEGFFVCVCGGGAGLSTHTHTKIHYVGFFERKRKKEGY